LLSFEFATATRVIFGAGTFNKVGSLAAEMGWRALVTSGFDLERSQPLLHALAEAGVVTSSGWPVSQIWRRSGPAWSLPAGKAATW
jgi:hypothetical protein